MSMMSNNLFAQRVRNRYRRIVGHVHPAGGLRTPPRSWIGTTISAATRTKASSFIVRNLPKDFFAEQKMDYQEIIAGTVGKENTYGTIVGRISPGPFTYCRVSPMI